MDANDDYVREKTRRIVAHEVLRRTSKTVQGWQREEEARKRLAKWAFILLLPMILSVIMLLFLQEIR